MRGSTGKLLLLVAAGVVVGGALIGREAYFRHRAAQEAEATPPTPFEGVEEVQNWKAPGRLGVKVYRSVPIEGLGTGGCDHGPASAAIGPAYPARVPEGVTAQHVEAQHVDTCEHDLPVSAEAAGKTPPAPAPTAEAP